MKKGEVKLGIRWKLLLTMTGLITMMLSVLTLVQISSQKDALEQSFNARISLMKNQLISQGKMLSGNLASQVQNGIASFDLSRISDLLRRTVENNQDLHYVILMDNKGIAYVDTLNTKLIQTTLHDAATEFAAKQNHAVTHEYGHDNQAIMEFIIPIQVGMESWGVLRLGFSLARLHVEIAKSQQMISRQTDAMVLRTLIIAMLFFVVGSGVVFWLAQKLSRPILMLADSAGELARGNFAAAGQLNINTKDEIEVLTTAFSEMSKNLQLSHSELENYSYTLEQEVDERTRDLAIARDQAVAASQSKSDFLSMMSHEIRTPINAIMGMMHLALQTELSIKQNDYISKADAAAHALLSIINDILDFSKIEAGYMEIETVAFDLEHVLSNLSAMIENKAHEKGLEISFHLDNDVPRCLNGDPLRLGQILLNLVGNAIKFTEEGNVTVLVKCVEKSELLSKAQVMLEISVEDSGIGLTLQQIDKLFQSFAQADSSTTRKYGGTGLGLAISKQLVKLMGGAIRVESVLGKGSRFIFTAIFGKATHCTSVASKQHSSMIAIAGARILLVEDNAINQQIASEILQQAGVVVSLANNGREGVSMVQGERFDAVLMDLQMPEMDGYEATRLIRQDGRFNDLPIIAMTAHTMVGEREKCLAAGMNDHTPKPIDIDHLFSLLRQWIVVEGNQTSVIRAQTVDSGLLTNIAGFDVALCLKNMGGNETLLRSLLLDFYQQFAGSAVQIHTLLNQGDMQQAQQLAHTIKGTSGNLFATDLYAAASQLNEALEQGVSDTLPDILDQFKARLDQAMASIASMQQQDSYPNSTAVDMAVIKSLLSELTTLIERSSIDADRCFQRLKAQLHHPSFAPQMLQLEHAINDFDFDGAKVIVLEMKEQLLDTRELE